MRDQLAFKSADAHQILASSFIKLTISHRSAIHQCLDWMRGTGLAIEEGKSGRSLLNRRRVIKIHVSAKSSAHVRVGRDRQTTLKRLEKAGSVDPEVLETTQPFMN